MQLKIKADWHSLAHTQIRHWQKGRTPPPLNSLTHKQQKRTSAIDRTEMRTSTNLNTEDGSGDSRCIEKYIYILYFWSFGGRTLRAAERPCTAPLASVSGWPCPTAVSKPRGLGRWHCAEASSLTAVKGAERSGALGGEAVWKGGDGRLRSGRTGKTACGLDGGAQETDIEGKPDGLPGLSRNGSRQPPNFVRDAPGRSPCINDNSGAVCGGGSVSDHSSCLRQRPGRLPRVRPEGSASASGSRRP